MEYPSALSFLMEELNITVKELSSALNVDYSLVSKWKRNTRPLTSKNIHLKNLAKFFMDIENKIDEEKLERLLKIYNPQIDLDSSQDIEHNLCLWFTGSFSPLLQEDKLNKIKGKASRGEYDSEFSVFRGNTGRREAVLQFMDYIIGLEEKQKLLLFSQEELSWMLEDQEFLKTWQAKLFEILQKGHIIKIIHCIDRDSRSLAKIILEWLPLYFAGGLQSWYYPKYCDALFKNTFFVLENHLAIHGLQGDGRDNRYTAVYYDKQTTSQFTWMFNNLLKECNTLVQTFPFVNKESITETFKGTELLNHMSIMVSNYPPISFLSESTFESVLDENKLSPEKREKCLNYYNSLKKIVNPRKEKANHFHIYSKRAIELILTKENFEYLDLSAIAEKKIKIKSNIFRKHLTNLLSVLQTSKNFEVALIPGDIFKINLFVREDDYVFAWEGENAKKIVMANEPTVVATFLYQYLDFWEQAPRNSKEKSIVIEKIKSLC